MSPQRPKFDPVQCVGQELMSEDKNLSWVPMISCVAGFPPEIVGLSGEINSNFRLVDFF